MITRTIPSSQLDELISLLGGARKGDEQLDKAIEYAVTRHACAQYWLPKFTSSVDAALTLVPDGTFWLLGAGRSRPGEPLYGCVISRPVGEPEQLEEHALGTGEHDASLALAICIAAFKARRALA